MPLTSAPPYPAHTLQELLEVVATQSDGWQEALRAAQEIAVALSAVDVCPPTLDHEGRHIYAATGSADEAGQPILATHWMFQHAPDADFGHWVAAAGGDTDLVSWFAGSDLQPEEWMRRPIHEMPQLGTLRYRAWEPWTDVREVIVPLG